MTHWAIFSALIAPKLFFRRFSASVAHPNFEKSSAKRVTFAQGAVLQNDMIYHTCNFVTFRWLMPLLSAFDGYTHICLQKWCLRLQFLRIFTKMCSPLEREAHFWKPTLSNPPSNIHFLEHWRPEIRTHWAIFWTFIALLPARCVFFPLQSPLIVLILARDLCILGFWSAIRNTTTLITLAIL